MQDSKWHSLNKQIKFKVTTKLFFGIYPYALYCEPIVTRTHDHRTNTWAKEAAKSSANRDLDAFNESNNTDLKFFRCAIGFKVYSKSLEDLYTLAFTKFNNCEFLILTKPKNNEELKLLEQGYILTNKNQTHPYILTIRSGFYEVSELQSLGHYIKSLQDQNEVKITTTSLKRMFSSLGYFTGCKIRLKDGDVAEFIRLICPKIVGRNQEKININK
jgi:hypothetical protein